MASAVISISRDSGYADFRRDYRVVCDGVEVGRISDSMSKEFTIAPGRHRLIVKIDWCTSNEVGFTIGPDQVLSFSCGSNLRGLRVLFAMYYATLGRKRYLWLRQNGISQ
jgi:hypothetical protein